jgi:hypothetical protein
MINNKKTALQEAAEQVANNTTGWIGHVPGQKETIARGQTFIANAEGDLQVIEIFSNIVSDPGKVVMTLHHFDPQARSWGPALGSASVEFQKADSGKWVAFNMPGLRLDKGKYYGFRLDSQDSYIGVGEAAGSAKQPPFNPGQEWEFTPDNQKGDCFSYFSLAYKVGIRA